MPKRKKHIPTLRERVERLHGAWAREYTSLAAFLENDSVQERTRQVFLGRSDILSWCVGQLDQVSAALPDDHLAPVLDDIRLALNERIYQTQDLMDASPDAPEYLQWLRDGTVQRARQATMQIADVLQAHADKRED